MQRKNGNNDKAINFVLKFIHLIFLRENIIGFLWYFIDEYLKRNLLTHCPLNAPTRATPDSDSLSTPERRHWQTRVYSGNYIAEKKKNH